MSYKYLGNFSATPPEHSRAMSCDDCRVEWVGCWDNFQCPQCGRGELPKYESLPELIDVINKNGINVAGNN